MPSLAGKIPVTECILVTSKASSQVKSGIIVGILLASVVFLAPGGPMSSTLGTQCSIQAGVGGEPALNSLSFWIGEWYNKNNLGD